MAISNFNDFINSSNMIDQIICNEEFTWKGPDGKMSRIDRVLVNGPWMQLFPDSILLAGAPKLSDHRPIIWVSFEGWAAFILQKKFRSLKALLRDWKANEVVISKKDLLDCENEIRRIKCIYQSRDLNDFERVILFDCKKRKKQILTHEESKKRLHSRVKWLKLGDKNTKFFHLVSRIKQQSSFIAGMSIDNIWVEDPSIVKDRALQFFKQMFSVTANNRPTILNWDTINLSKISAQQARTVEAQFDADEIFNVINEFDGNKTPGPDGFSLSFFKKAWYFLEDEVVQMFSQFFSNPSFPKGFNSSFIVLIPKSNLSKKIEQMRPISLINAPYKIIAKVLANRLKFVVSCIVSENQHGFVPSRALLDGVMFVSEVANLAKKTKCPLLMIKLDFSKAYDSISHEFLLEVLSPMGFVNRFISWIKCCISGINFSVLLNGSPSKEVAVVLSKLLSNDLSTGALQGFNIANNNKVNHSQFADDTILFAHPSLQELNRLKEILALFSQVSGLKINHSKTMIYGIHVSRSDLRHFANTFGCEIGDFPLEYLGVPIGFNSGRIAMWDPVIKKFKRKLAGWKGRCLSFGGRLVMVKAVLSSLPLHFMAIYKAPSSVIIQLERFRRNFLWGGDCLKSKPSLVKWQSVCLPVDMGGLGITPLRSKNFALLAKWWSKMNSNKKHVWQALVCTSFGSSFSGKLMHNVSMISTSKTSSIWKDLLKLHHEDSMAHVIGDNTWSWKLGDGLQISFWNDHWVGHFSLRVRFPNLFRICSFQNGNVRQFRWPFNVDTVQFSWNLNLYGPLIEFDSIYEAELKGLLSSFKLNDSVEDSVIWNPSTSGEFSVAEAIRIMVVSDNSQGTNWRKLIWNNRVPSKVSIFHWLACKKSIPVRDVLIRRHILPQNHSTLCVWCETEIETIEHLLLHCPWTFKVWSALFQWWNIRWIIPGSILSFSADWYNGMGIGDKNFWRLIGPATIWAIWLTRNDFIFNGNYTCWASIVRQIKLKVFLWATSFKLCYAHQSYVWDINPGLLCHSS
ncbi:uncharacterized protein [Rutidosis leptorrhynchoides]|uniref:uncharacterized protein n=1 Tax=Rutidosis leptorrhynchoides TaxID=125765 RepID=UPI003A9988EB